MINDLYSYEENISNISDSYGVDLSFALAIDMSSLPTELGKWLPILVLVVLEEYYQEAFLVLFLI